MLPRPLRVYLVPPWAPVPILHAVQYCSNQSASRLIAASPNLTDLVSMSVPIVRHYPLKTLRVYLVPLWAPVPILPDGQYCSSQSVSRLTAASPNLADLVSMHTPIVRHYPLKTLRVYLVPLWAPVPILPDGQYCSSQSVSRLTAASPNLADLVSMHTPIVRRVHPTACFAPYCKLQVPIKCI